MVDLEGCPAREAAEEAARVHSAGFDDDIVVAANAIGVQVAAAQAIVLPKSQVGFREKIREIEQSGGPRDYAELRRAVPVAQTASPEAARFRRLSIVATTCDDSGRSTLSTAIRLGD